MGKNKHKSYILMRDFNGPYVISTGMPHRPTEVKTMRFKKGQIISGEMRMNAGKPAFVLYKGVVPVPTTEIKQVVTKDIFENASGSDKQPIHPADAANKQVILGGKPFQMKIIDAALVGAIAGFVGVWYAEKKTWITPVPGSHKNKLIGAAVGAIAGFYLCNRFKK